MLFGTPWSEPTSGKVSNPPGKSPARLSTMRTTRGHFRGGATQQATRFDGIYLKKFDCISPECYNQDILKAEAVSWRYAQSVEDTGLDMSFVQLEHDQKHITIGQA